MTWMLTAPLDSAIVVLCQTPPSPASTSNDNKAANMVIDVDSNTMTLASGYDPVLSFPTMVLTLPTMESRSLITNSMSLSHNRHSCSGEISPIECPPMDYDDHADIAKAMPTYDEIVSLRAEYPRTTDPSEWHTGRLDYEVRLVKEGIVG